MWSKYWSFSFSISPSNEYSGLISFTIDLFDLLAVQGTLKSVLQYHSSKASIQLSLWSNSHIHTWLALTAKSRQSCLTLCDPIDGSPPGSSVPGNLQARTLEWVAISFSNAWKWKVKVKSLSCVWFFATPSTAAYQAPPSMGISRQEYWSGVSLSSPIVLLHSWLSKVDDDKVNQQYLCKRNSNLYPLYLIFQWGNWREYN